MAGVSGQGSDKEVKWYPGFRNNQSGVKYDIITHGPLDEYEEKRIKFENMKARYRSPPAICEKFHNLPPHCSSELHNPRPIPGVSRSVMSEGGF